MRTQEQTLNERTHEWMDVWLDGRTHKPTPVCFPNFFKIGASSKFGQNKNGWGQNDVSNLHVKAASQENMSSRFPTKSETNRAVRPQKIDRCFEFRILEVEGLYNLCSETKVADQLRG